MREGFCRCRSRAWRWANMFIGPNKAANRSGLRASDTAAMQERISATLDPTAGHVAPQGLSRCQQP